MSNVHAAFCHRLRKIIELRGTPRKTVAWRSGLAHSTISHMVCGRRSNPSVATVWALAGALQVDPYWLLGLGDDDDDVCI